MKKLLLISMLLFSVAAFSQTKSAEERAEIQFNKITSKMDLTDAQSEFLKKECQDYQTKVTNLRKDKSSMEEEDFHNKMKEYRLSFYTSFKGQLSDEAKSASWDRMNTKIIEK